MNKCVDCKLKRVCKYKDTIEEITKETNSVITFDCSYRTVENKDKKQKSSCSGKCGECQDNSCKATSKKATSKKVETKNNINKTNKDNQTKDNKNQTKDNKNSKEIDLVEFLNGLNALFR